MLGLHGQFYVGLISVDDPGAHLNTTAFVLSTALTRVGTNEVFGVAYGVAPNGKAITYNLTWTL